MEVFSIFSSNKQLINSLIDFFLKNSSIKFLDRDRDTIYFKSIESNSMMFYVHLDTDFDGEMELNFEKDDKQFIKNILKSEEVFMLDISYKDSNLLYQLLSDFVKCWKNDSDCKEIPVVFHDPFKGFVEIDG